MALPNGLAQVSDLGSLQGSLGYNIVDIPLMTATTAPGSPAAGTFHSSITNRAPMYDLRKDLSVNMGINRFQTQQIYEIQDEFGPNGERVFGVVNDAYGQIRFVGSGWYTVNDANGQFPQTSVINDYVEITFCGTGLNLLLLVDSGARDARVSVDGGSEGSNIQLTVSSILNSRNYSHNHVIGAVSGLSFGLHTVKVRLNNLYLSIYGVEILNEQFLITTANTNSNNQLTSVASTTNLAVGMDITGTGIPANTTISSIAGNTITMSASATATATGITVKFGNNFIKVNPGTSWKNGQKLYNSSQHLSAYNSGFESGILGTVGGRVAVYQKADGSIAKAVTPTGSQLNLGSANHSNEEIVRKYYWREFGAGRTDDFQSFIGTAGAGKVFTLDDGTTTLVCSNPTGGATTPANGETFSPYLAGTDFVTYTFIGTGLDVTYQTDSNSGTASVWTIFVDGTSIGTFQPTASTTLKIQKIVSGLPYGTHTVRFVLTTLNATRIYLHSFYAYQPKTPTLPTGAQLIGTYNIMANFVASTGTADNGLSTGTLRKTNSREMVYTGTWSIAMNTGVDTGFLVGSSVSGNYVEYAFWGTGFCAGVTYGGTPNTLTVQVDGSAYTGAATVTNSGTWTPGTSTILMGGAGGSLFIVTNLSLGFHKVRITKATATDQFHLTKFDIITPIHSPKDNGPFVLQNTLAIGSQGVGDKRLLASQVNQKVTAQTIGISGSVTTTSTTFLPIPEMSTTIKTSGGIIKITGIVSLSGATIIKAFVNGQEIGSTGDGSYCPTGTTVSVAYTKKVQVPAGTHKVDLYWRSQTGTTSTSYNDGISNRFLTVEET